MRIALRRGPLGGLLVVAAAALVVVGGAPPRSASASVPPPVTTTPAPVTTIGGGPATTVANPSGPSTPGGPAITVPPVRTPQVGQGATIDDGVIKISAPQSASNSVLLVVLITLISVVPGLLLLTTVFPRFLIVLGLARQALGLNTTPPNQVLAGLAAFLTLFVMGPTFSKINDAAIQPATRGEISTSQALERGWEPMREFMLDRTRTSDLNMLFDLVGEARPQAASDLSPRFVIPAFILSELRSAFLIGFLVWIPFLLVDLIVSSVLAALGMMMMPPVVVSLPVKLALFVLVDGWALIAGSLLRSAH